MFQLFRSHTPPSQPLCYLLTSLGSLCMYIFRYTLQTRQSSFPLSLSLSLSLSLCALDLDLDFDSRRVSLSLTARSTSRSLSTSRSRFPGPAHVARLIIRRKSTRLSTLLFLSLSLPLSLYPTPTRLPSSTLSRTIAPSDHARTECRSIILEPTARVQSSEPLPWRVPYSLDPHCLPPFFPSSARRLERRYTSQSTEFTCTRPQICAQHTRCRTSPIALTSLS